MNTKVIRNTRYLPYTLILLLVMILVPGVNAGTSTFTMTGEQAGFWHDLGNWNETRNGLGTGIESASMYPLGQLVADSSVGEYEYYEKSGLAFNTSGLPDNVTVVSATVTVYGTTKTNTLGAISGTLLYYNGNYILNDGFTDEDYSKTNFTRVVTADIPYDSYNVTGAAGTNVFVLNQLGRNAINKTGMTLFLADSGNWSADNQTPGWVDGEESKIMYASAANVTYPPKLTVTYAIDGTDYNISWTDVNQYYPSDNIWYAQVNTLPLHPNSSGYISATSADCTGFSGYCELWLSLNTPLNFVNSTYPKSNFSSIELLEERNGDNVPYPVPLNPIIMDSGEEWGMTIVGIDENKGYEFYKPNQSLNGTWYSKVAIQWDYTNQTLRTTGAVSASGMPYIPGLITYDEVVGGAINHSSVVHMRHAQNIGTWPATYGGTGNATFPPYGTRFRLNASFDTSSYDTYEKVILESWKRYGFMVEDENSNIYDWTVQLTDDTRWDDIGISGNSLISVRSTDFEVVNVTPIMINSGSGQVSLYDPTVSPTASFTKNATIGVQPAAIQFNDTSTNTPTGWNWSFGDGNWSNGTTQNATHTYDFAGTFNSFLIATNAAGSNQSATQVITVNESAASILYEWFLLIFNLLPGRLVYL
jgi:hypothetical protein